MDIRGKTVLITGGSSGIGRATAEILASAGARVVLTGQTLSKAQKAAQEIGAATGNDNVTGMTLNLADFEGIKQFSEEFRRNEKRLDVLINNAAYLGPKKTCNGGMEMTFTVNHLGHFLLTSLLLDRLRECVPSRVVCVTSDSHRSSSIAFDDLTWLKDPMNVKEYDMYKSYARSKLGNVLFVEEFNRRFAHDGVTSYAVHPGVIRTSLLRNWPGANGLFLRTLAKLFFDTPEKGARAVVHCAVQPGIEGHGGRYFNRMKPKGHSTKPGEAERLWELSIEICLSTQPTGDLVTI